jgi:pimeloyl-ACP methyl ester carboxylesterase
MGLAFEEHGLRNAPTILFLHGGGGGRWMWQPQVEGFSDYHLLIPDLPGHGDSASIRLTSIEDAANRVASLIREKAHGGKTHVVGLSLGAQVTVYLLAQAPELLDHAVISSALLKPMAMQWLYNPGFLRFLFNISVAPFRKSRWWARVNMKYSGGIPEKYFPQYFELFQKMTASQFVDVTRVGLNNPIPMGLERANNPCLVLCGEKEYREMKESTRAIAAALPDARAYQVAYPQGVPLREQHNWSMTHSELFNRTIRAWVENKRLPPELKSKVGMNLDRQGNMPLS